MDEPQRQHRADPHRRLQRHTYQEGPNFLFLATRGGRPPKSSPRADLSAALHRETARRLAEAGASPLQVAAPTVRSLP